MHRMFREFKNVDGYLFDLRLTRIICMHFYIHSFLEFCELIVIVIYINQKKEKGISIVQIFSLRYMANVECTALNAVHMSHNVKL